MARPVVCKTHTMKQYPHFFAMAGWVFLSVLFLLLSSVALADPVFKRSPMEEKSLITGDSNGRGFIAPDFPTDHITAAVAKNLNPDKDLPASYDSREDGYVSPVKNQGTCGACYAFGSAADLESRLLIDGMGLFDISENSIKECHYLGNSCLGGNQYMTISYLSREGAVLEACDPYVAANVACSSGCESQFIVTDWIELSGGTTPDPALLKQYIADYGPIHTTVFAGDDTETTFRSQFNNYNGTGALYFTGNNVPNHSVFIVGWDDSIVHAGGTGAWIVKNSWGTSWGGTCGYGSTGGYFYIAYGSASIGQYSSLIKEYMVTNDTFSVLSNDEAGYTMGFGGSGTTLWGLSSVTTPEDTYLHRVEFWTTDVTTDVDVFVYQNFNGSTASGMLATKQNQSFAEPGYHYVQLDDPLALSAGQTVYLAVKFANESYDFPLAADGEGPVDSGKSYLSVNGSTWFNGSSYDMDTTIRARVSTDTVLSVEDPGQSPPPAENLPVELRLEAAYPNPFNPTTTVEYSVPQAGQVDLRVYDLKGAVVRTLVSTEQSAGTHQVHWNGRNDQGSLVPSGVYFCRADAGHQASSLKLILLK